MLFNKKLNLFIVEYQGTMYGVRAVDNEAARKLVVDFINTIYPAKPPYTIPLEITDVSCVSAKELEKSMKAEKNTLTVL